LRHLKESEESRQMGLKMKGVKCFNDMPLADFDMSIVYIECGAEYSICISEHGIVYAFGLCNYQDFDVNKQNTGDILDHSMEPTIINVIS